MPEPLPSDRWERLKIHERDPKEYLARLSATDIDKLLLALSKTLGAQPNEVDDWEDEMYNVRWEYVPKHYKY